MVLTVDPELVIVGGGISKAGPLIVDPVRQHLEELCLFTPDVLASTLGDESVVLGTIRLALDKAEEILFDTDVPRAATS